MFMMQSKGVAKLVEDVSAMKFVGRILIRKSCKLHGWPVRRKFAAIQCISSECAPIPIVVAFNFERDVYLGGIVRGWELAEFDIRAVFPSHKIGIGGL